MARIVIIEGDELMNALLGETLTEAGYFVRTSAWIDVDAEAADLLIVDVYMPRSAGAETLRDARAAHPKTPIIAISGQFCSKSTACADALGVRRVIPKPFSRDELLEAVRAVIGPPA
jgi:DNA-binding response OmpR family regulator